MIKLNNGIRSLFRSAGLSREHFSGHFDGIVGRRAFGWVRSKSDTSRRVVVELLVDGIPVAEAAADRYRPDLSEAGLGDGHHGFQVIVPEQAIRSPSSTAEIRVKGRGVILPGGPQPVNPRLITQSGGDAEPLGHVAPAGDPPIAEAMTRVMEALYVQNRAIWSLVAKGEALPNEPAAPAPVPQGSVSAPSAETVHAATLLDEFAAAKADLGDVVIFSIIDWHFRVQRPQHLASNLARMGYRITYVSVHLDTAVPGKPLFFLKSKPAAGVFELKLRCHAPVPSVYGGFSDPTQVEDLANGLDSFCDLVGIVAPIVILQYPTWLPLAQKIPGARVVFDCLDHLAGFETTSPEVIDMEHRLIEDADLVVTTSEPLSDTVSKLRENTVIRNGAEVDYFSAPPARVIRREGPVIGYFGAISDWFDSDLVYDLASSRPDWQFVLIGSTAGADVDKLAELSNVLFTGEIPYRKLTEHLYGFDCCLIPFKINDLIRATNPVKIYEYFSAGKPVVATRMPELQLIPPGLVALADTADEFAAAIDAALAEDAIWSDRRRQWAFGQSWWARAVALARSFDTLSPRVTVVVLTYNGLAFTQACLDSLDRHTHYPNLEILVVDNASSDGTQAWLQEWAQSRPHVKLLLNETNLGFAAGNNVGIRAASGDYVVLINNDTYVTKGWVRDLIRPMLRDASLGLTGPITNMIGNEQRIRIAYADMEQMAREARKFTRSRVRDLFETGSLAFFCVAIRRSVIEEVGLLDESYGLGMFEDDDYCRRVAEAGYRMAVVDGVFIHHHLSASFDTVLDTKYELLSRNQALFESKWGQWQPHQYRSAPGFGE